MSTIRAEVTPDQMVGESSTREQILRAAARVFLGRGYEGTSMDLVASESGAGRRTVYNHFESKRALFDATVSLLWEGMPLEKIIERREVDRRPEQILRELGQAIASFWAPADAVAFLHMIVSESKRFPELAESFFKSGRGIPRRALADYLRLLDATGTLKIPDADLAAGQFISLINGLLLWDRVVACGPPPSVELQRHVVDEAVETFLCRFSVPGRDSKSGPQLASSPRKLKRSRNS